MAGLTLKRCLIQCSLSVLKLSTPIEPAYGGWALDKDKVEKAIEQLGIQIPTKVRYLPNGTPPRYKGRHSCVISAYEGPMHIIRVNEYMHPDNVTETLWHELAHAQQCEVAAERAGISPVEFFKEIYSRSRGSLGMEYYNNTFEVMARKVATDNKHKELIK